MSRVLNNSPRVTPKTTQLVKDTIDKLGYSPNINAKKLRENNSRTILVVVPDLVNPMYGIMINSIMQTLQQFTYSVSIYLNTD